MRYRRASSIALVAAFVLAGAAATGQDRPPDRVYIVTLTVRSGMVQQFEDYINKIGEAAEKTSAPQHWFFYQVTAGGPGGTYLVGLYLRGWGEMGEWSAIPQMLKESFGEREGGQIYARGTAAIESSESRLFRLLPDHSTKLAAIEAPAAYYYLVETQIHPYRAADYELFLAKLAKAQEAAAGAPMAIRRVSELGPQGLYMTGFPLAKLGDRDGWPSVGDVMTKAYGEEEARRFLEMGQRAVRHRTFRIIMYRPDLSRWPATAPTSE